MLPKIFILTGLLVAAPAWADAGPEASAPIDLGAGRTLADDPVLERLFPASRLRPGFAREKDGGFVDDVLERLGVDKERLLEALSEVDVGGAIDNWRDEQSGEVGLSFGLTDQLTVGPSLGLRWAQEHTGAYRDEWSHQLKLGARYAF